MPADPSGAPTRTAEVLATYPHSTGSFTEGLAVHAGWLYESTGTLGHSQVRVVAPETGVVRYGWELPADDYGEGLTVLDGRVYQMTWQTHHCFVYDAETLERLPTRSYPEIAWGLADVEGELVVSDGTSVLRFLDPESLAVRRTLEVRDGELPVDRLNELEAVEGELWANVWRTDRIARIDLESGHVREWVDLAFLRAHLGLTEPEAVLNGIAYDAESRRLFVTGKLWPELYEIRVPAPGGTS